MFYNKRGFPLYPGKSAKVWDWRVGTDTALPSWLVQTGTSSVLTLNNLGSGTGFNTVATCATKTATPTSGDQAGIATNFNIDFAHALQEVSFICYGFYCNESGSTVSDQAIAITNFDSANAGGLWLQNNAGGALAAGEFDIHNYADSAVRPIPFAYSLDDLTPGSYASAQKNWHKPKDIGVTIRPVTKEVFITAGDPYDGAGVIYYTKGLWTNTTVLKPFQLAITTNTSAIRTLSFSGFRLRTVY